MISAHAFSLVSLFWVCIKHTGNASGSKEIGTTESRAHNQSFSGNASHEVNGVPMVIGIGKPNVFLSLLLACFISTETLTMKI